MPQHIPDLPEELAPLTRLPLLKRLAARLFGSGLNHLRAQHAASWLQGQADGFRSGHSAGVDYGFEEGHAEGLEQGRQVLFISDTRPQVLRAPGIDDNLF
ncbi:DNA helicase UvrD, partial [Pseudomonas fragi]|nr:DNA helicase UvrD [Pseudomonas sp. GC01]